jgi:hypothetical protein
MSAWASWHGTMLQNLERRVKYLQHSTGPSGSAFERVSRERSWSLFP